jgi:uncharacterized phosphatase
MPSELILIRHGQAVRSNADYVRAPLTPLGREQAAVTGRYLQAAQMKIDGFYSSPLRRAQETAALIGAEIGHDPRLQKGLQEMTLLELPPLVILESLIRFHLFADYLRKNAGKPVRWPIIGRVSKVLGELIAYHPGQSILLVTHGGVISSVLAWYMPAERKRWWREVENCSLTRLRVEGALAELAAFNDIRHLKPNAEFETSAQRLGVGIEPGEAIRLPAADTLGRP